MLSGPHGSFSALRMSHLVDEISAPPLAEHVVMLNIGGPFRLEERLDGRTYRTFGVRGDVAVVPAGAPSEFRSAGGGPQRVESFALGIAPSLLRATAEGAGLNADSAELIGGMGLRDPDTEGLAFALMHELQDSDPLSGLYAESLATALTVRLIRAHSSIGRRWREQPASGGLSRTHLRRVTDFIEENLDGELRLATLAGVAHMSPFHFARLFKLDTGLPPHQYVLRRRVERARRLLSRSDLPLHEVARLSGFSDQSHLTRQFGRLIGTTPTLFRLHSG